MEPLMSRPSPLPSPEPTPPSLATRLLLWLVAVRPDEMAADLDELFAARVQKVGLRWAQWRYWQDVLSICVRRRFRQRRPAPFSHGYAQAQGPIMLNTYIRLALRQARRHKLYTLISITSLAFGIAGSLVIMLFVADELGREAHHEKAERIYGAHQWWDFGNYKVRDTALAPATAPALKASFPEIEETVRLWRWSQPLIHHGDKSFYEDRFVFADASVFEVFTVPFLMGDAETALQEPYSVVLTPEAARKYFGDANPIGQQLTFWDNASANVAANRAFNGRSFALTVTGVVERPPLNATLQFDFLASFSTFGDAYEQESWRSGPRTYLLLHEGAEVEPLAAKLPDFVATYIGTRLHEAEQQSWMELVSLTEVQRPIFLFLLVLGVLACCLLTIGCINFMNLITARALDRAREVGLRKVVGAHRPQLIRQFLTEALLMALLALPVAVGVVALALPTVNALVDRALALDQFLNPLVAFGVVAVVLGAGLAAGSYPALYLSRFQPARVLKGSVWAGTQKGRLRHTLVVAQFVLTVFLFVVVLVLYRQMMFAQSLDLGFDEEQIAVLPAWQKNQVEDHYASFRDQMLRHPEVVGTTVTRHFPGYAAASVSYTSEQIQEPLRFDVLEGDADFVSLFGFELVAGRRFDETRAAEADQAVLINRTAVERLGWTSPDEALGKRLGEAEIIGVVEDFHLFSVHQAIGPTAIRLTDGAEGHFFVAVKLQTAHVAEGMAALEQTWASFFPERPFVYSFLDDRFAAFYNVERMALRLVGAFSVLAMLLACLGLLGLAAYATERRTKEIGIRKVVGASVVGIAWMFSKSFLRLVLLANLIAWPLAYLVLNQVLQFYAYRVSLAWWMFALAGGVTLLIALLTVNVQALRAARANPIQALRHE